MRAPRTSAAARTSPSLQLFTLVSVAAGPFMLVSVTTGCEAVSLDDGECPAWTRLQGERCVLRAWILPTLDDALGEPGARDLQVALGEGGDALVAWSWTAQSGQGPVVLAESRSGDGWSLTEARAGEGSGLEPAVAVSPEGRALLAWKQERTDGAIHVATRDPHGSWRWPDAPLSWSETAYEPRVAFAPDGEAFVLWNQWTGTNFGVAMALRPADRPEDPFTIPASVEELLSPPVNFANAPRLALGDDGEALVT